MATSSITKEFYIKDEKALNILLKELNKNEKQEKVFASPSLEEGRKQLATFVFR